ncbi:MAG: NADH:flavin oxidoreductase [Gemmatales bacterium]|nr:NADH:flavin oxidoreductase [Gemmatales bacterium]MDW8387668.1 NADH:flavin oxidoreductase [Gemmatales bacterium]
MARFFHFKSLEEIRTACRTLRAEIGFREDIEPLFRPIQIGPIRVGNRLCIQPMEGCDGTSDGKPDNLTFRRFERFGAGGAKLIWGEATAVVPEGRANPRQLLLNDANASAIERLLRLCRQAHRQAMGSDDDLLVGLQLTHSGRYSQPKPWPVRHDPLLDPLTVVDRSTGRTMDAEYPLLGDDDLKRLEERYIAAAVLAWRIGFQFVDLKQCHSYLLNELLGARSRTGLYGGSFENRTRFVRNVLAGIRQAAPGLLVATRLNVFDGVPFRQIERAKQLAAAGHAPLGWGVAADDPMKPDLDEPLRWIGEMRRLGVVLVNVTVGNPYASPHLLRPFEYPPPDGYDPPEHPLLGVARHFAVTAEVQRAFPDLALVGSGYSYLQEFWPYAGADNVAEGRTTFVGIGRAALAQPDFARRLLHEGRLDRRRVCRTFSYCTALMRAKDHPLGQYPTGCPPFDKEIYGGIWDELRKRR